MALEFSAAAGGEVMCAVQEIPEETIQIALLAFGFGTPVKDATSPGKRANEVAAATAVDDLEICVENLLAGAYREDLRFVCRELESCLQGIEEKIQAYGRIIAQGLYAGGCVYYACASGCCILPFGGGTAYSWDKESGRLVRLCGGIQNGMIRDALGAGGAMHISPWQGKRQEGDQLILASDEFRDLIICGRILDAEAPLGKGNATAELLRRELHNTSLRPTAVIEIR